MERVSERGSRGTIDSPSASTYGDLRTIDSPSHFRRGDRGTIDLPSALANVGRGTIDLPGAGPKTESGSGLAARATIDQPAGTIDVPSTS